MDSNSPEFKIKWQNSIKNTIFPESNYFPRGVRWEGEDGWQIRVLSWQTSSVPLRCPSTLLPSVAIIMTPRLSDSAAASLLSLSPPFSSSPLPLALPWGAELRASLHPTGADRGLSAADMLLPSPQVCPGKQDLSMFQAVNPQSRLTSDSVGHVVKYHMVSHMESIANSDPHPSIYKVLKFYTDIYLLTWFCIAINNLSEAYSLCFSCYGIYVASWDTYVFESSWMQLCIPWHRIQTLICTQHSLIIWRNHICGRVTVPFFSMIFCIIVWGLDSGLHEGGFSPHRTGNLTNMCASRSAFPSLVILQPLIWELFISWAERRLREQ